MPSQSPAAPPPPTLHKPVPMGTRVLVPEHYMGLKDGKPYEGEVVGVAFFHVIYSYIVLLDAPFESSYGVIKAVTVTGGELVGTDGTDWKIDWKKKAS